MKKIYIFADDYYEIKYLNEKYFVNANTSAILENINYEDNIEIYCSRTHTNSKVCLNKLCSCNQFSVHEMNGEIFLYLHFATFDNLIKIINEPCEILIYDNSIRIIFESLCFCMPFCGKAETLATEKDENVYIFNEKNIVVFNKENKTFITLKVKEYKKTLKNTEILCKLPKINGYFLLFIFSNNKLIEIKKLKKQNGQNPSKALPYLIFYLCKFNFDECRNFVSDGIEVSKLSTYFDKYDNLIELENNYYIFSQQNIAKIDFEMLDNKVINID